MNPTLVLWVVCFLIYVMERNQLQSLWELNARMIVSDGWEMLWIESVVISFKKLSTHAHGGTWETMRDLVMIAGAQAASRIRVVSIMCWQGNDINDQQVFQDARQEKQAS
jgi:hypothetical protein